MDTHIYNFLTFPRTAKHEKQIESILRTLTNSQKYKIQQFIKNILYGKIPLTDAEYRKLSKHKTLIRNLSIRQFAVKYLMKNYNVFNDIIHIMLKSDNNDTHTKNDLSTIRGMGEKKSKRKNRSIRKSENNKKPRRKIEKTNSSSEENLSESEMDERTSSNEEEEEQGEEESMGDKSSQYSEEEEEEEENSE